MYPHKIDVDFSITVYDHVSFDYCFMIGMDLFMNVIG